MTIVELIDAGARRLEAAGVCFGHGTTNAFDEAAWLVLWQLGLPLDSELDGPQAVADRQVTAQQQQAVQALFASRITTRKPTAYLTGEAWLQGVPFYADHRAIVPRSLIAELVANGGLDYWLAPDARRALDLCTGGASLAILAAMTWPQMRVDATDISPQALELAALNVERHALGGRIALRHGDGLAAARGRYDLILCNPPYVNAASMAALPPEYRAEPGLALAGGPDGMDFIRRLLAAAPAHLRGAGVLVLEIGNERALFEAAFAALEAVWLETSAGADQVCALTRPALVAVRASNAGHALSTPAR